ncbi:hypothetical protein B0H13DRAFT_1884435 [Mycena leptocephala]|nr:hypothetical protein B0H13DRAFT_1884435 [Mycena leptocephala]
MSLSDKGSTGSKSTGGRLGKAGTGSKRTMTDSDSEEPTAPSPKRRNLQAIDEPKLVIEEVQAEKDRNSLRNDRHRDVYEGVATVQHRIEEVAGQATQVTMVGGTGGNGGDGGGIGGGGGVGEGPRLIENFFGQLCVHSSEGDDHARIREDFGNAVAVSFLVHRCVHTLSDWSRLSLEQVLDSRFSLQQRAVSLLVHLCVNALSDRFRFSLEQAELLFSLQQLLESRFSLQQDLRLALQQLTEEENLVSFLVYGCVRTLSDRSRFSLQQLVSFLIHRCIRVLSDRSRFSLRQEVTILPATECRYDLVHNQPKWPRAKHDSATALLVHIVE